MCLCVWCVIERERERERVGGGGGGGGERTGEKQERGLNTEAHADIEHTYKQ